MLGDLPRFVVAPFRRRWHLTWGATPAEASAAMPGDGLLPRSQYCATRAITIDAPPERVWPWLVQVGVGRGGWYADDLLDNLARPSLGEIVPELQDLRVGQRLAMTPQAGERTAFTVDSFEQPSWLLWRTPNRTFAWRLTPLSGDRTRLVSRMRTTYEWRRPLTPFTVMLMELADYPMMRRMLRGIRDRAETRR
ncbi:SRPBCC family protein [Actinoplanes sp. NPDC051513]|uniref:SRPBCC family protein n=1 Tax=Actinoplanes sp. NPDC051513 TaxID=3363908 RepID=UPI0037A48BEB